LYTFANQQANLNTFRTTLLKLELQFRVTFVSQKKLEFSSRFKVLAKLRKNIKHLAHFIRSSSQFANANSSHANKTKQNKVKYLFLPTTKQNNSFFPYQKKKIHSLTNQNLYTLVEWKYLRWGGGYNNTWSHLIPITPNLIKGFSIPPTSPITEPSSEPLRSKIRSLRRFPILLTVQLRFT